MLQDLTVTSLTAVLYCCSSTTDTRHISVRSVVILICAEFPDVPLVEPHRIGIKRLQIQVSNGVSGSLDREEGV